MRTPPLIVSVIVLAAVSLMGLPPAAAASNAADGSAAAPFAVPDRYLDQVINWESCFPEGPPPELPPGSERLECGSFHAPRNWHNTGEKIDVVIAVSRLRPAEGEPKGSVLTNPGGPGGAGRMLELMFLAAGRDKLVDNMEVVGIDVRGTGESTNVTCGQPQGEPFDVGGDARDRRPENLELMLDVAALRAKSCQVRSGELGRFITTEQTVADLDLLRHLLGRSTVSWVGYSGGSWLGAYYATYFPERVDAFVLDSNTEFTASWQRVFRNFALGFEPRFRIDFTNWAARFDSLYGLGATGEDVRQTYEQLRARLAVHPVELDGMEVDGTALDVLIVGAMYDKNAFPMLAETVVELRALAEEPGAVASSRLASRVRDLGDTGPLAPDAGTATLFGIICNDTAWRGDGDSVLAESASFGARSPLWGFTSPFVFAPCVFWDRPPGTPRTPDGVGVPPVLMVQSVRDPATPLPGARKAHAGFAGSRLLTVTDEGDHGIYALTENRCVDDAVEAFIVDGVVPDADFSCPGMPLPDPTKPSTFDGAEHTGTTPSELVNHYRQATGPLPR